MAPAAEAEFPATRPRTLLHELCCCLVYIPQTCPRLGDQTSIGNPTRQSYKARIVNYEELEDLDLVARVQSGDRQALSALYDRYSRRVFALAARVLNDPIASEEVTQDVFMSVWRRGSSYSPEKGKFTTWLFSIAHNRTIDELRRRRRDLNRNNDDIQDHLSIESGEISPAEAAVAQSEYAQVREALDVLPAEQRLVIELSYFKGLTQAEISERTGQPLGTVKTRMRLALKKLRTAMSNEDDENEEGWTKRTQQTDR